VDDIELVELCNSLEKHPKKFTSPPQRSETADFFKGEDIFSESAD
jgi:hypothetical protein